MGRARVVDITAEINLYYPGEKQYMLFSHVLRTVFIWYGSFLVLKLALAAVFEWHFVVWIGLEVSVQSQS